MSVLPPSKIREDGHVILDRLDSIRAATASTAADLEAAMGAECQAEEAWQRARLRTVVPLEMRAPGEKAVPEGVRQDMAINANPDLYFALCAATAQRKIVEVRARSLSQQASVEQSRVGFLRKELELG